MTFTIICFGARYLYMYKYVWSAKQYWNISTRDKRNNPKNVFLLNIYITTKYPWLFFEHIIKTNRSKSDTQIIFIFVWPFLQYVIMVVWVIPHRGKFWQFNFFFPKKDNLPKSIFPIKCKPNICFKFTPLIFFYLNIIFLTYVNFRKLNKRLAIWVFFWFNIKR